MNVLYLFVPLVVAAADDSQIQNFITGTRLFTGDVYNQILLDNSDNILVSPFSAETIFALTQSGARGATGEEIRTTLHLPNTKEATEEEIKTVLPEVHGSLTSLNTINKMYVENNFEIKESFQKVAKSVYGAELENIEFAENEAAAESINQWVEDQTNGKIQNLLSPDELDASTLLILINTLYFQGNFSIPFNPFFTNNTKFFTSEVTTVETPMMYTEAELYNYYENEELDAQFLEIPFEDKEATMLFILPNKKEGIAVLEKQMRTVLSTPKFTSEFVEVLLPKFRIESTIDFKKVLLGLGVHKAFDAFEADFSGIAGEKGDLFVAHAKQKTYIDVSELGVEAAAATEVGFDKTGKPTATKSFIADHPFLFVLKVKDIVLFEGRVVVPEY